MQISGVIICMINSETLACETQDFASLLGGTQLRREGRDGRCAEDTGMHEYAVPAVKNLYIIKSGNRRREGIYGV